MGHKPNSHLAVAIAGLAASFFVSSAMASETRGFVVSWLYYANISEDADCPHGLNPSSDGTFKRILREKGKSPEEIEKLMENFPNSMAQYDITNRGVIDGKPANAYVNPTSTKDPNLYMGEGKKALGFNLDGKDGPKNFTDPETGETGVDNMFYRAIGCSTQLRGAAGKLPVFPEIQWDTMRDNMPAWLIEITTEGDWQNADDAVVRVVQATRPIVRNANGLPQADITFIPNPTPRTDGNVVHGKIKNGVLTTQTFDFFMLGEPFSQAEYAFRSAKMRWTFNPDGTARGLLGGYQNWRTIYTSWALGGSVFEINASFDVPGLYYALRKSADAFPDPETGENTAISSTYLMEAVPAFIAKPNALTAQKN